MISQGNTERSDRQLPHVCELYVTVIIQQIHVTCVQNEEKSI